MKMAGHGAKLKPLPARLRSALKNNARGSEGAPLGYVFQ
jgi:hypothetical protein